MIPCAVAVGAAGAAVAGTVGVGYRWLRRWGATPEELAATLPGDELCPEAWVVHTRAVTVTAPPAEVWPWLAQIGQDRSGFFSYTWAENLVGCRMPEIHERRAEWSTRAVGDRMWMAAPDRFGGGAYNTVAQVHPDVALVTVAPDDLARLARGEPARWVWQFATRPGPTPGTTRLVVRSRYLTPQWWLEPIHFAMERKLLLTIARLAGNRPPISVPEHADRPPERHLVDSAS
jgi:hypothetical protein